jgi:phosphoribosyl 1,2-cyclic phosphate phosphodiesterase
LSLKVTLLGTGTSHGVPMIGCECAVCRSTDPRDRRTRPSILIEAGDSAGARAGTPSIAGAVRHILVDTSTDLREQALRHEVTRVDAILFTHSHADHIMGLDEIRRYNALPDRHVCVSD